MKLLFADDELSLQELMRVELPGMGHQVTICPDGKSAITALGQNRDYDCLLVDLDMPGAGGIEVIEAARKENPEVDAVILTGKGTLETAIAALRNGVFDYLTKPCKLARIEEVLRRVARKRELTRKYLAIKHQGEQGNLRTQLIGSSPVMLRVQRLISKIAPTDSTVVILGETGTGKELAARLIHNQSPRAGKPFVAINCGALPENLIESELFGHKKGSFTGADATRIGLIENADEGTLFLDEIGELPRAVQSKFLRFLESGEVRKIGENESKICNVRIVCATLRNLEEMVRAGDFREDLWFRINTFEIHLPPLRNRIDDLPDLILHLSGRYQVGVNLHSGEDLFTKEAYQILAVNPWPGNVRQLANVMEHSLIMSDKIPIDVDSLPPQFVPKRSGGTNDKPVILQTVSGTEQESGELRTLRDIENAAISQAVERYDGDKHKAADELGISLKTLYNKLSQHDAKKAA
ncbi:MAG: sigma-54 dependent transcriptional regulator [Planctomycetaceae bacterium]|jgi:two-component system NtrC family response regulator|nr:sigma-54 dependent transcriptional regulator [Planctomycetaceae bacterium]